MYYLSYKKPKTKLNCNQLRVMKTFYWKFRLNHHKKLFQQLFIKFSSRARKYLMEQKLALILHHSAVCLPAPAFIKTKTSLQRNNSRRIFLNAVFSNINNKKAQRKMSRLLACLEQWTQHQWVSGPGRWTLV